MITHENSTYDLIQYGFVNTSYQEFVDSFLADQQSGRKTTGFDWDADIQIDFTYHQVQAELGLDTMPTYVDVDSPSVYKTRDGFELSTGSIPRMKHGYALDEKILRTEMIMKQRTSHFSSNLSQKMMDLMFDQTKSLINGNYNALTYQRDQMISTGSFELTSDNNPSGLKSVTFSAKVPTANKVTLTGQDRWFTNTSNLEGTSSDPLKNLKDQIYTLKRKGVGAMHFEVDYLTFRRSLEHKQIKEAVARSIHPLAGSTELLSIASVLDEATMKSKLEGLIGVPIHVIDNIVAVDKFDKSKGKVVKEQIRSFASDVWVLVPDGVLGTIKAVEPIAVPDPATRLAWYDGGRTVLKQWYDTRSNTQYIESELTALVVPDKPQYMLYLTIA